MNPVLNRYLKSANLAIRTGDGRKLASLLDVSGSAWEVVNTTNVTKDSLQNPCSQNLGNIDGHNLWKEIFLSFLVYVTHVKNGDWENAYTELARSEQKNPGAGRALERLLKEVKPDTGADLRYIAPVVISLGRLIKNAGEQADERRKRMGEKPQQLEDSGRVIQGLFNALGMKNMAQDVQQGCQMEIANLLIKIYFKLNTLNNCKTVSGAIQRSRARLGDRFPKAHIVTYSYYMGQLAIFDEQWEEAERHLLDAFQHCLPTASANLRRILRLLIPVRMLLGKLPTDTLLTKYGMGDLRDIVRAVRQGDVGLMTAAMRDSTIRFIQNGTIFLYEKLGQTVYRRLVKKLHAVNRELSGPTTAHQLPLKALLAVLQEQGVEMNMIHLECILGNLIGRGFIKGYISHKLKVLVAHRDTASAYPDIKTCLMNDSGAFLL